MSLGSSIRSAAQATFSAYRSVPIRWRLAGGSAALTFVILAAFAVLVGHFTDRQVTNQFFEQMDRAVVHLQTRMKPRFVGGVLDCNRRIQLAEFDRSEGAEIRVFSEDGALLCSQETAAGGAPLNDPRLVPHPRGSAYVENGYQVEAREIKFAGGGDGTLLYARPLSSVDATIAKIRLFLSLGILGGTLLALLAGLATAQRAMRPIAQLTDMAREIERTRDPSLHIPHPKANDEVAELARTLEGMLGALDAARSDTEAALARQREFVADASHELRTPLTSVLANLELLADELAGEQAESARAALRSTHRMRRLVGDLLLLARADAERRQPQLPTDLGEVLTDAAAEIGAVAEQHELIVHPEAVVVAGARDDLHRLALNLMENAVRHTPPGTRIRAWTEHAADGPRLVVEDNGPGIPPELQRRVFERFVRGGGDGAGASRGTGLGLSIVRAVAESHRASVALESPERGGTRFVITFPEPVVPQTTGEATAPQTSTTTGSTIGRRRSRS